MNTATYKGLEVGSDVPALPDMNENDIQTPCLVIELDTLELDI
jgi:3-hydroxy-D-aspartate aldolase